MPIIATCTCGAKLKAPPKLAGKKVKCPSCAQPILIPTQGVATLEEEADPLATLDANDDPLGLGDLSPAPLPARPLPQKPTRHPTGKPAWVIPVCVLFGTLTAASIIGGGVWKLWDHLEQSRKEAEAAEEAIAATAEADREKAEARVEAELVIAEAERKAKRLQKLKDMLLGRYYLNWLAVFAVPASVDKEQAEQTLPEVRVASRAPVLQVAYDQDLWTIDFAGKTWTGSTEDVSRLALAVPFTLLPPEIQISSPPELAGFAENVRLVLRVDPQHGAFVIEASGHPEFLPLTENVYPKNGDKPADIPLDVLLKGRLTYRTRTRYDNGQVVTSLSEAVVRIPGHSGFKTIRFDLERVADAPPAAEGQKPGAEVGDAPVAEQVIPDGQVMDYIGHLGVVHSVLPIDNGTKLMTIGADRTVRTWDLESGLMIDRLPATEMRSYGHLAMSSTGEILFSVGGIGKGGVVVRRWHPDKAGIPRANAVRYEIPPPSRVFVQAGTDPAAVAEMVSSANAAHHPRSLAVSPSGEWVAVTMADLGTTVFNASTGEKVSEATDWREPEDGAVRHTPFFISDDEYVVDGIHRTAPEWISTGVTPALATQAARYGRPSAASVANLDLATLHALAPRLATAPTVLIPGTRSVLLAVGQRIFQIELADRGAAQPAADELPALIEFVGHGATITSLDVVDADHFVSGDLSGAIHYWNRATYDVEAAFKADSPVLHVRALSTTQLVSVDASGAVQRWDVRNASDTDQVARFETMTDGGVGEIVQLLQGKEDNEVIARPRQGISAFLIDIHTRKVKSDDISLPTAWSDDFRTGLFDTNLIDLRANKIKIIGRLENEDENISNGRLAGAAFDGDYVFVGRDNGRVDRHHARTGRFQVSNKEGEHSIQFILASLDRVAVLAIDDRRLLRVLDPETLAEHRRVQLDHPLGVSKASWCPGHPLSVLSGIGGLTVLNLETGAIVLAMDEETSGTFTVDGSQLITSGDISRKPGITFRKVGTWEVQREITTYPEINDLQVTRDGATLVVAPKSGGLAFLALDAPTPE